VRHVLVESGAARGTQLLVEALAEERVGEPVAYATYSGLFFKDTDARRLLQPGNQ
jgi:hypothetical protein